MQALPLIEASAGLAFLNSSQAAAAKSPATPAGFYPHLIAQGLVWVAADLEGPFGFASTEAFEDGLHIWELAVRLDAQRQGAGRALLGAVSDDATRRGLPAVTLTTFTDVAWNAPFYRRMGYVEIPLTELSPRLAAVRVREGELGLDLKNRCAMRLDLQRSGGA